MLFRSSIENVSYATADTEAQTVDPFVGGFASGPVRAALTINNVADLNAAFGEGSEIANAFRYAREVAVLGTVRQYVNVEWRALRPMTATQQREADARAAWRFRVLNGLIPSRMRPCVSCGVESIGILCFACEHPVDAASVLSRWRERLAAWQRHVAPLPLGVLGGVCASRLYPEAPRAHDAVRLRCPLRRSPDRGVTLCVAQPTTDCVTPTRREA